MQKYDIFTDSSCDLNKDVIEKYDLKVMQLEVTIDDNEPVFNRDIDITKFYEQLKNGANAKTSAVTLGHFKENMKKSLEEGKDIIYLGFSSGLSATYNNGVMIINELREKYPERKIIDIDTLCATGGQGLVVYYAAKLREEGATIEEVEKKVLLIKDRIQHQVKVNDLFFLKRGGRISATTAIAGSVLNIKPIITMDITGRLATVGKVRGKKAAVVELFNRMKSNENIEELPYVYISHSACIDEAENLKNMVVEQYPKAEVVIGDIGPVIGAHTGPGALVISYVSKEEKIRQ